MKEMYLKVNVEDVKGSDFVDVFFRRGRYFTCHKDDKSLVEIEDAERCKQPVIVYCKDCKHKGTRNCVANAWTIVFHTEVKDDFYCGLAERVSNE